MCTPPVLDFRFLRFHVFNIRTVMHAVYIGYLEVNSFYRST